MTVRTAIGERMGASFPDAPRFTPRDGRAPAGGTRYCSAITGSPRLVSPLADRTHAPPRTAPPL